MRVVIVDDERPCLEEIEYLLRGYSDIVITGAYDDPLEALAALKNELPDAVFLDIGMPHISGIELAEKIHQLDHSLPVVFLTAHSRYLKGVKDRHPLDCLLKPISKARFDVLIQRLRDSAVIHPKVDR